MASTGNSSGIPNVPSSQQQSPLAAQRAKANPETSAQQTSRFPLGYKEGFSQWWAALSPAATEHKVLSFIPFLQRPPTHADGTVASRATAVSGGTAGQEAHGVPAHGGQEAITDGAQDPYGPRRWASSMVQLDGKDRAINEFSVERIGEHVENNLVMLHGYGAGLAFWYKNYEALSRLRGWRLYSLDLLGMGRSSRPPFRIQAKDKAGKIAEAENWFVDALEDWRKARRIERFTLMGHSLGGYMATAYALKYPGHLNKLILVSPVGIPEDPYAVNEDLPEPQDGSMVREFTEDQGQTTQKNLGSKQEPAKRPYPKWLVSLWDANISPFSIVRWAGPLGPKVVSGWTTRRFSHLPREEAQALHDYSYSLFRQRGSGEYALGYVLAPGAFARSPLIRRIHGVGRQFLEPHATPTPDAATTVSDSATDKHRKRENGYPVVLVYGENDWMDVAGGYAAEQKIRDMRETVLKEASAQERAADEGSAKVLVVPKAGHHVYLDGWEHFNKKMKSELEEVGLREKKDTRL